MTSETEKKETQETLPEGLTSAQVAELTAQGKVNISRERSGKSYPRILFDNLFTFFNMVWALIAVLLVIFKSYGNMTFLFIIVPNILIGTFLEIRAKYAVGRLSVTTAPRAAAVRDGELVSVAVSEVVLGDVLKIGAGQQVPSDAEVILGVAEANESMLTGESNAIRKEAGDRVLAGSFLVSGAVFVRVTAVGRDNYVHKIESAAKNFKKPVSNLFRDLSRLIKYIGVFMVPMAALLYWCNWYVSGNVRDGVLQTSGSIIGMIPAGVYLLVTLTLTLSVIKLARKRTMVQDMYSIEMLASADVLCLDKTGTITDGTMCVREVLPMADADGAEISRIVAALEGAERSINSTSRALLDYFGAETAATVTECLPFSSARKYSAATLEGMGTFSLGAPHFVRCPISDEWEARIGAYAKEGMRVLILARHPSMEEEGVAIAMIAISDRIRPAAAETIAGFQSQGVRVKIISGDHPATVSTIAARVGVRDADKYISCEGLSDEELAAHAEDCAVFGRVSPEQKVLLVKTLKAAGHTVAMTGDGINDTLALKESNCSIAMADGSEVARKISNIVLLDSDFSTLPDVVREGRRCINNVRQSAALFLMKTVFVILLSIFSVVTVSLYPFQPKHMFLLETFIIGIAAFFLALEPNNKRIEGTFIRTVLTHAIPNALALFLPALVLLIMGKAGVMTQAECSSVAMITITVVGYINLIFLCRPYTRWRAAVVGMTAVFIAVTVLFLSFVYNVIDLDMVSGLSRPDILVPALLISSAVCVLIQFLRKKIEKLIDRIVDSRLRRAKRAQ